MILYNKKVTYHVKIGQFDQIDFISEKKPFEPIFVFDTKIKGELLLYPGTKIKKLLSLKTKNKIKAIEQNTNEDNDDIYKIILTNKNHMIFRDSFL